jgi:RNA polymerase sigma factor (sigma-70 family)
MAEAINFQDLFVKFSPGIRRIAYKLNGHYRSFDHNDLCQEALLHLWNDFCAGKLADKTDSYILQGCYFHLKNCIRKINEKPNALSFESLLDDAEGAELENMLLNKYAIQPDMRRQMDEKLIACSIRNNGFSPREKKIIFFLADGLTTRQIGEKIGFSHVSVVKAVKRIRKKSLKHIDNF